VGRESSATEGPEAKWALQIPRARCVGIWIPTSRHVYRDLGGRDPDRSGGGFMCVRPRGDGVTSAEVCPCHQEPWAVHGGYRVCLVKKRQAHRRWKRTNRDAYLAGKRQHRKRRKERMAHVA